MWWHTGRNQISPFGGTDESNLNRRGRQFSRLLAAEVCASAVVVLDTPCSVVLWRVLDTHSIRQFPLHFLSRASPCAITFQLDSTCQQSSYEERDLNHGFRSGVLLFAIIVWNKGEELAAKRSMHNKTCNFLPSFSSSAAQNRICSTVQIPIE